MNDDFKYKVENISAQISLIEQNTTKLEENVNKKITSASGTKEEKNASNEILAIQNYFWENSKNVKEQLKIMENDVKDTNQNAFGEKEDFSAGIKNNHWQALTNKFKLACTNFRTIQLKYKNSEEQKLISQYLIENPSLTVDQIKEKIKNDQETGNDKQFGDVSSKTKSIYSQAEQRNKRVKDLSVNIAELCELINELHEMVKQQGGKVDKIEVHTDSALGATTKAKASLGKALDYQRTATRFKRIMLAIAALLILGILAYLGVKLFGIINRYNNDDRGGDEKPSS